MNGFLAQRKNLLNSARILRSNVFKDGNTLTISLPKELYSQAGHYKMYIVDQHSGDKSNEIYFNVN